ncbi:hypothetical protein [Vallicoccus soli]|uniref:GAF domain-containing protein n=1 Tax=Vallicoccus soli TaxID=2339232 RepID=A0A3A3ZL10_9ACTN|nr:hypothetical protein [Vallicoccus soli]RJK96796.1 hypothetical protein D5H78_05870 [Vallicoccus soli]
MAEEGAGGRLAGKVLVAVTSGVSTGALGVHAVDPFLDDWQRTGLVVVTAVIATGTSSATAVGEYRRKQAESRREDADFFLRGARWAVHDLTGLDVRDLGVACYAVRRPRLAPWAAPRLRRIGRVRSTRRPAASGVRWRPGVGVVGVCVRDGRAVVRDVEADERPWLEATRRDWESVVPEHVKIGLSYDEFRRVRGKYHVVLAVPIIQEQGARSRVVGAVALDGPSGSYDALWTQDVRDVLTGATVNLRRFVL